MGTLFSALDIARAGLQVAQLQLDTTAHNIANVNREGYSRQRVDITTRLPISRPYGFIGRGPGIAGVDRIRNGFLDGVYRDEVSTLGFATERTLFLEQVEDIFLEPGEDGLSSRLGLFFDALQDFSVNVESFPTREALLSEGEAISAAMREIWRRVEVLRTNANEEVRALVPEINSLASRIADSNLTIARAESTGKTANDLRDGRDLLIDELSRLAGIVATERENGMVDVFLGGNELVVGRTARELETIPDPSIDPTRPEFLGVRYADTLLPATILDGQLAAAIRVRDVDLMNLRDEINTLAAGLIEGVNAIHSQGAGLTQYSAALSTTNPVSGAGVALDSAGLPFTVSDGAFELLAYDATGTLVETVSVPITAAATTLNDIAAVINGSTNLGAAVNANGTLTITPNAGISFTFANDTANVLPALGANGFFTGYDAATMDVNDDLHNNPGLISSRYDPDLLNVGNNAAALDLAELRNAKVMSGGNQTIGEYFQGVIVDVGITTRSNADDLEVQQAFIADVQRRRLEVHGVNLDEEVTSLVLFQRAFEASARVVTVTDRMLDTLLNIVR